MLQRSRSSSARKLKFLIVLPLMLAMLTYVSCSEESAVPKDKEAAAKEEPYLSLEEVVLSEKDSGKSSGTVDVPFILIDNVPVFPGCESLESNEDLRSCISQKITDFVNRNFNTSLGKKLNLTGMSKIYVQFRINTEGLVEVLGVRGPHPALEEEAERVVKLLPQMTPGKHRGEEVGVLYALPITLMVAE